MLQSFRFSLICLCISTYAWAAAPTLKIALGETKMPYVSAETQSGIEYDIVTQALQRAGFTVVVDYLPNKRAQLELHEDRLDAAINNAGRYLSDPYIAYQNMAITLCSQRISIASIDALAQFQIAAFHNANQYLGADFARIAANKQRYRELSPQQLMNRMLLARRFDVAISDINIFKHVQQEIDPRANQPLCPYSIFPPTVYRLEFRDPLVRDRFNQALKALREQGLYEQLAKKYDLPLDQNRPYFKP
jgi:polar amino acid transport system substrate-binding protein